MDGLTKEEILNKENEEKISYDKIGYLIYDWIIYNDKRIPKIETRKFVKDSIGTIKVRLGINRLNYKVPTGLYAIGNPDENSKVIVSANYKLTFDLLRNALENLDLWILILDTKGINVWCAAGKGTFSSRELIYQLEKWDVKNLITHNEIILPQLGATSMEPYKVKEFTGLNINYGPIRAEDLKHYILTNEADDDMRRVSFNLIDRLVLAPIEMVHNLGFVLIFFMLALILNFTMGINLMSLIQPFIVSLIIGSLIFPLLLPYLPMKSFSIRSLFLVVPYLIYLNSFNNIELLNQSIYFKLGYFLLLSFFIIYQSFNFTGSTTFTSFSGVKKEAKYFKLFMISALILSPLLMIYGGVQIWH